jgi:cobalt-zinc-cadmium resistance protein CzcA
MIQRLVALALKMPFVIFGLALCIIAAGLYSYKELDIEAYPNPCPPLVEIIAQPEGTSAEDVERYVTVPMELALAGMPGLDHIRSQSLFGLTDVKCYFKWGTEYAAARQEVINRITMLQLPNGVQPQLSPWNAIGEVFRYELRGDGYSLRDLKSAEDWILERQFKQVPGVIDVVSFGGETKQYQVGVDPFRLRGHGVTLPQLMTAIQNGNTNVGGQRLAIGEQAYTIRGVGLIRNVHDIDDIVVTQRNGIPIRVRDVAVTEVGHSPRLGIVGRDSDGDVVQGVVLMRYGGETPKTLQGIYEKLDYIEKNHVLPPGMKIVPYYDRGHLVKLTTHTVLENLVVGMVLVSVILWVFLGHTRAAICTAINIPMALLIAFSGMVSTHTPANLISLGAVDFGIVVDSTVIMMESIFRHLGAHGRGTMRERIISGAEEVSTPMFFSTLIITTAFIPLFTMKGVSGVIFAPMAATYAFAIGGAIVLALTLTPALAHAVIPANAEEKDNIVMRTIHRMDTPLFKFTVRNPWKVAIACVVPVAFGLFMFTRLGGEFMPKLEEGNFWIRATLPTSISLEQSSKYVGKMRAILRGCPSQEGAVCDEKNRKHPEVETVVSQLGRPDDGTDVAGFQNIELFAPLIPFDEWEHGMTKEKLTEELSTELRGEFPGVVFNFSQVISDNVEEATSGVKGENSIKVYGPDVAENEKYANAVMDVLSKVKGIQDLGIFPSMGQPSVRITPDRRACSRYGLNTGDVEAVIQAAIGGQAITQVLEGDRRYDLTVRWLPQYRESVEAIREITVSTDNGSIPLGQIADIRLEDSPSVVFREDGLRYTPVKFSVRGRDLESTVKEAQDKVEDQVKHPYTIHFDWSGELNELKEAQERLMIIIPVTLLGIFVLVYISVKNFADTAIVLSNIPIAVAGGILALHLKGINFSVSAAMGFISIFGIAIQDAILVVTYYQRLREREGMSIEEAALEATKKRVRPVLMTTLVALFGLLPAALSNGIGSQTQKPLALVVIGGAFVLAFIARYIRLAVLILVHRALDKSPPSTPSMLPPELAPDYGE